MSSAAVVTCFNDYDKIPEYTSYLKLCLKTFDFCKTEYCIIGVESLIIYRMLVTN